MKRSKLPQELQPFLPSSPVSELDVDRDKAYIIQSLLRNSHLQGWKWLMNTYTPDELMEVIRHSNNLREKDVRIWMKMFDINEQEVACLQTKSHPTPSSSWRY